MKFNAYHKIKQFKDIVRDIQFKANYKGQGPDGEPVYEETKKPILTFRGTVKLHGTNAGICYTPQKGIVAQKRVSLLNPEDLTSHFGFNQFVQVTQKESLSLYMKSLWNDHCKEGEQITIYGEWAGIGIQKGVGISKLDKSFYVFDCKVYNSINDTHRWIDISDYKFQIDNVYNIYNFINFSMNIDFNNPGYAQNDLISYTNDVENNVLLLVN